MMAPAPTASSMPRELYDTLEAAIADCSFVLATTARAHDQAKPVVGPAEAARQMAPRIAAGETVAILFGRERNGLENDEVALADRIVTLPVNPAFASLNLAQAVVIVAYEWFKLASGGQLPFAMPEKSRAGAEGAAARLLRSRSSANWKRSSSSGRRTSARPCRSICAIFLRACSRRSRISRRCTASSWRSPKGRKGPARGGVLDGEEAEMLRALLAEHGGGRMPKERGPVRGLARLLRRNPTEAERLLWQALVNDRRFAGRGFKRQTPVGQHICDFVSFPLRLVIELVPAEESAAAAATRAEKRAWLEARDYTVLLNVCQRRRV